MKNIYLIFIALLVAGVAFISCNPQKGNDVDAPVLTIANGTQLSLSADAGRASFNYELQGGVEGGELEVEMDNNVDWISDISIEEFSFSGIVSFDVAENENEDSRSTILTLKYTYGKGESVTAVINIIQVALEFDYQLEIGAVESRYYGDQGLGYHVYEMRMGEEDHSLVATGAEYYSITFLCSNATDTYIPEPGLYEVVGVGEESDHTIQTDEWSVYLRVDDAGSQYEAVVEILEGEIRVERDGDVYTITGEVTDEENKWHKIYYQGHIESRNMTIFSTLQEDVDMDLTGMTIDAYYNARAFTTGNVWMIVIYSEPKEIGDFTFQLQCITPTEYDMSTGLGSHTFVADLEGNYGYDTFTPGSESAISYNASWIFTWVHYDEELDQMYVGDPAGPFIDGEVVLERNADGTYDISIDVVDDNNHTIKAQGSNLTINHIDNIAKSAGLETFEFAPRAIK